MNYFVTLQPIYAAEAPISVPIPSLLGSPRSYRLTQQTVEFEKVLLVDNDGAVIVGTPTVDGAKVVCEVVTPLVKGDKVLVFHKRRRKGYKKLRGHRQQFTELTIKSVVA